ncbi:MAG: SGNH/GDSL hydrolase family protein, partial [Planctomycetota bacterium]
SLVLVALECLPLGWLFPPDPRGAARDFCAAGMFVSRDDELRHFDLVPSTSLSVGARQYRHNARGLRGPEVAERKAPNTLRIAVVGDSYTYGWGVEENETIPAQLGQQLERHLPQGRAIEVVNAGVPAYDTGPEFGLLRDVVMPLAPDVVVLVFQTNDITTVDYFYLDDLKAFYACELPLGYRLKRSLDHSRLYHLLRRGYTSLKRRLGFAWFAESEWPRTSAYLDDIIALCRRAHVRLLIANLPHFQIGSSREFSDQGASTFSRQSEWVNALAREHDVPCVDILPLVRARVRELKPVEALYVDPVNDHHLNAAGCALVAGAVAEQMVRLEWLLPSPPGADAAR